MKGKLLKLNKALYGLKQSVRIQYYTLIEVLITKLGFKTLEAKSCILINNTLKIIICVYVDDLAIVRPNKEDIDSFIKSIKKYFNIKELGLIKDYLRIEVEMTKDHLKLNQTKYIEKVLEKFNIINLNPISTPLDSKYKLKLNDKQAIKEDIKYF